MILTRKQAEYLADNNFGAAHTDEEIKAELISAGLLDDPFAKSSGIDGDAGDWTQTEGAGLTDNVDSKTVYDDPEYLDAFDTKSIATTTSFVKPTIHAAENGETS